MTVTLSKNQAIRATLAFSNKNGQTIIQNNTQYYNIDVRIIDATSGMVLAEASQNRNNVEIVEFVTQTARTVYIQTRITNNVTNVTTDWALEVDKYNL